MSFARTFFVSNNRKITKKCTDKKKEKTHG